MDTEQMLQMMVRLKRTPEGQEFLEYLNYLSDENYEIWKLTDGDICRGKSIAYDDLIKLFETCDERLIKLNKPYESNPHL